MMRWFLKRWVWAGVFGTTAAVGLALAQGGGTDAPPGPPKVGDVITLKFQNGPDQQVKILKVEKQPDGSYHSEVKNTKTGETFTLVDRFPEPTAPTKASTNLPAAKPSTPAKSKDSALPRAKPRESDPLLPPVNKTIPEPPKKAEAEREWKFGERIFGDRTKTNTTAAPTAMPQPTPEPEKRRGLINRLFGKKETPPVSTTMPATSVSGKVGTLPAARPTTPIVPSPAASAAMPPTVRPTPQLNSPGAVAIPQVPPGASTTGEPPRRLPAPATVPAPLPIPTPPSREPAPAVTTPMPPVAGTVSTAPPALPTPPTVPVAPPALPTEPPVAPAAPTLPAVPPALPRNPTPPPALPTTPPPALPSIPVPPGGVSTTAPMPPPMAAPLAPSMATPVVPAAAPVRTPAPDSLPARTPPAPAAVAPATTTSPALTAMMQELQPHMAKLNSGFAPSERILAAQTLAGGRHGSTDIVKSALLQACLKDPCPLVRATCIDELCKLGYREPEYLEYIKKACDDPSEDVRLSAKAAVVKLGIRK
jgi:hypothetical protein